MKLEEIRALIEAATPGPWTRYPEFIKAPTRYVAEKSAWARNDDFDFIAAARDLMPKLLAVAEALKDAIAEESVRDELASYICGHDALEALEALEKA